MTSRKNHVCAGFVFTLTDAVVQAAHLLDLDVTTTAAILQTDPEFVAALYSGGARLAPARANEWRRAMDFVRLFCLLEVMNTANDCGRHWLRQLHAQLDARPIDVLLHSDGLRQVLDLILQGKCSGFNRMQTNEYRAA